MREAEANERARVREGLLALTREGPASGWCDRLAEVAGAVGIEAASINWCEAPRVVAHQMVSHCQKMGTVDRLVALVARGL